jgi:hypothetical protein
MRKVNVLIIAFVLCACNQINIGLAIKKVDEFHEMIKRGEYAQIYINSSENIKKTISQEGFVIFLTEAKNNDLGVLKKSTLKSQKKIYHLLSHDEVVLIFVSEYSKRNVTETFIFESSSHDLKLQGYNYTSVN